LDNWLSRQPNALLSTFTGSSLWRNISTAGFNLEGETSNPDEIVNLRSILFWAKFAGDCGKNAIMTIAIQSDDPLNIKHTSLFSKGCNLPYS
jgi:hypothetical protein